jgi:hypothetical protein
VRHPLALLQAQARMMMNDVAVAIGTAIDPPVQPKSRNSRLLPGTLRKKGAPRPYRKIAPEVLVERIAKLTTRLQRAKKQHETARLLLTKYSHESFYREKEAIEGAAVEEGPAPLPALDDAGIATAPA